MFDDDDEGGSFAVESGTSSNLANLFGGDRARLQSGNQSLKYTPPKQPTIAAASSSALTSLNKSTEPSTMAVVHAVAANVFKYENNAYTTKGKLGCAILSNPSTMRSEILLYVSKQQMVAKATIGTSFAFTLQANCYASFYDDQRQLWSLRFDSDKDLSEFSKHIGLARGNGNPSALIRQDLMLGEDSDELEVGDSVEMKYTGWFLTDGTFGAVFDSNIDKEKPFRFKLGQGKVIKGWDDGCVGMKRNGRRLLIIPPSLAYGATGKGPVPPNAVLIFEVDARKVKVDDVASVVNATDSRPHSESDKSIKNEDKLSRRQSITEQLQNCVPVEGPGRSKLLNRVAKMGKSMLPFSGAVASDPEPDQYFTAEAQCIVPPSQLPRPSIDVPKEPVQQKSVELQRSISVEPTSQQQHVESQQQHQQQWQQQRLQQQQNSHRYSQHAFNSPQQTFNPNGSMHPQSVNSPALTSPVSFSVDTQAMNVMFDTRQQVHEMRFALRDLISKIDTLSNHGGSGVFYNNCSEIMEASSLVSTVQKIYSENERLKKDNVEKSDRVERLNDKVSHLLEANQKAAEDRHSVISARDESYKNMTDKSHSRVMTLESEKATLSTQLAEATVKASELQIELAQLKVIENDLRVKVNTLVNSGDDKSTQEIALLEFRVSAAEKERDDALAEASSAKKDAATAEIRIADAFASATMIKNTATIVDDSVPSESARDEEHKKARAEWEKEKAVLVQERNSTKQEVMKAVDKYEASSVDSSEKVAVLETEVTCLKKQLATAVAATTSENVDAGSDSREVIKGVMNDVFKHVKGTVDVDHKYEGAEVIDIVKSVLKQCTKKALVG